MYPEEFSTETEFESVYFDLDPFAHRRLESFDSFVASSAIHNCVVQLSSTVAQLEQLLIQFNSVDGVLSRDADLNRALRAFSVFKQRIEGLTEPEACDFIDAESLLGRGKQQLERLVLLLVDTELSNTIKTEVLIELTQSFRKASGRIFLAVLEACERLSVYDNRLACLFFTTRRNLIEQTLTECAHTLFVQDQTFFYTKDRFLRGLRSALAFKYELVDTGDPELPPLDRALLEQAEQAVVKAVSNSGVLVHLVCQLQDVLRLKLSELRLSNIARIPLTRREEVLMFIDPTVAQLCSDYGLSNFRPEHAVMNVDDGNFGMPVFNPALFECLQNSLLEQSIGLNLHYPLIAERSASSAGLGKEQLLFAGNIIWVCLQSSSAQGQIERYHRNFAVEDLPWLFEVDLPDARKVELLAVHLMHLNESAQDIAGFVEAVYEYCQHQANLVDMVRGWFHLTPRHSFPWAEQLALEALNRGCELMYQYFSASLSGWRIRKLMQQCIESGEALLPLQHFARFDPERMRELVTASINAWWLPHAAEKGRVKLVRLLVAYGADVNARCVAKRTPLIWAVKFASVETVRALFEEGANPLLSYKDGRDLCFYASTAQVDREVKFELVRQALYEAALEPSFVEAALAWGHEQKTKRSLLKELDPRPCTGYVWAWVAQALLDTNKRSIVVEGQLYSAFDAVEQALLCGENEAVTLIAYMKSLAKQSSYDRQEILDSFGRAFVMLQEMMGKKPFVGIRPQFARLWADLANMPLWEEAPQLSVDESAKLTEVTQTMAGRVTRLDCLINAIRNSPNMLEYHFSLAKAIQEFMKKNWFSRTDTEFVWSIAADALSKGLSMLLTLENNEQTGVWQEYAKCFRGDEALMLDNGMVVSRHSCMTGQVLQEAA